MHVEVQDRYEEPANAAALAEEPLCVHRRTEQRNPALVLFVHGLGGSRYGGDSTWGHFPRLLFERFPKIDLGLYQYRSGLGRIKFWRSIDLESEAGVLADLIRDSGYQQIVAIAHSMGGLLVKATIKDLIDRPDRRALERIAGVFLMATPQIGSLRVPGLAARLNPDMRALEAHGELADRISRTFTNRVAFEAEAVRPDGFLIPTWGVLGAADRWVDRLSAAFALPDDRLKKTRETHTGVVKPSGERSPVFDWIAKEIDRILRESAERRVDRLGTILHPAGLAAGEGDSALPRVSELQDPYRPPFDVFPSRIAESHASASAGRPPYVRRSVDDRLDELLAEGRSVLITGGARAGKSRTAFEAIHRNCADHRIAFPLRGSERPLSALAELKPPVQVEGGRLLIWLADVQGPLLSGDLSPATVNGLRRLYPRLVIVATLETEELEALENLVKRAGSDPTVPTAFALFDRALDELEQVRLYDHLGARAEELARQAYGELVDEPGFIQGMGRFFAASERRWSLYTKAFDEHKVAAALATAAIDWRRAGMDRPIGHAELVEIAEPYLDQLLEERPSEATVAAELRWALDQGLLSEVESGPDEQDRLRAASDLVRASRKQGTPVSALDIFEPIWERVLDRLEPEEGVGVAVRAIEAGHMDLAWRAARRGAETPRQAGDAASLVYSGLSLMREGPSAKVRPYLERAAASADEAVAAVGRNLLASHLVELGDDAELERVEELLETQLESDDDEHKVWAWIVAGQAALRRGQLDRAELYTQRVLETRPTGPLAATMLPLVLSLAERLESSSVEEAIASALETDDPILAAAAELIAGAIAFKHERVGEALERWRKVLGSESPFLAARAAALIGLFEVSSGDLEAGERRLRPLEEASDATTGALASLGLGMVRVLKGQVEEARDGFRKLMDSGPANLRRQARLQLGVLEAAAGRSEAARELLEPFEGDDTAAPHLAQAAALLGDLQGAREYLGRVEVSQLVPAEQLLFASRAEALQDNPEHHAAAELLLGPFVRLDNPYLSSLAKVVLGKIAVRRRSLDRARELLGSLSEEAPARMRAEAELQLGIAALQADDPEEAERRLEPFATDPDQGARASFLLGQVAEARGDSDEARRHYQRAAEVAVGQPAVEDAALLQLGRLALEADRLDEAEALFQQARISQSPPLRSAAESNLSLLAERRDDLEGAWAHARAAFEHEPDSGQALARQIGLAEKLGDYRSMREARVRLGEIAPRYIQTLLVEMPPGAAEAKARDGDPAAAAFAEALAEARRDPEPSVRALRLQGARDAVRLARLDGRPGEAAERLKEGFDLAPEDPILLFERAALRREEGDESGARADAERAVAAGKKDLLRHMGQLIEWSLMAEGAEAAGLMLLADPGNQFALLNRDKAYAALGRSQQMEADYSRALEVDPDSVFVLKLRGLRRRERWCLREAAADLRRVAELEPEEVENLVELGQTLGMAGDDAESMRCLDAALEARPGLASALLQRGIQHQRASRLERSVADLDAALTQSPDDPDVLAARSETALQLGQAEEALRLLDRYAQHVEAVLDWSSYLRGRALHGAGRRKDAAKEFARALEVVEAGAMSDPMAHLNRALYLLAGGRTNEALEAYRERAPATPAAVLRLALIDLFGLERSGPWQAAAAEEAGQLLRAALEGGDSDDSC